MMSKIEVAVSVEQSKDAKGELLEGLCEKALSAMQYDVIKRIRLTGLEVDLLAQHKISKETIVVECKAHNSAIQSNVIKQLVGSVEVREVSAGWLMVTSELGKEAKGLWYEWQQKTGEKRRKLQIYEPENLISLLVHINHVMDSKNINKPNDYSFSDSSLLLVTKFGYFWIYRILNKDVGVFDSVMAFDAKTGEPVIDNKIIEHLSSVESSISDLKIITNHSGKESSEKELIQEAQSIVKVPRGDTWDDYRPARPQDFVGRTKLISDIFSFLDNVRNNNTETRLLALKSPSGWGKSSCLVKLSNQSRNKRNKAKFYIYAVDSRAASSIRYPELALVKCLKEAISDGFVKFDESRSLSIGPVDDPLQDKSLDEILQQLKKENKVILLFFDQFEEIFSKPELEALFRNFTYICNGIDSTQENIVLGFSWKTDGSVPAGHAAYYMWQGLADRRREFSLNRFSSNEISSAITKFSKEIDQSLDPRLKRYLTDHCQGYPWLLKKLCIHVYQLIKEGKQQAEIIGQRLIIKDLFERERRDLGTDEDACIVKIASDSPANYFDIENFFGQDVISSLSNKRLIIQSGHKLTIYWDIFRDYILTGNVPNIPVTYFPTYGIKAYYNALLLLLRSKHIDLKTFSNELGVTENTGDNYARDFVMIGNASRDSSNIFALQESEEDCLKEVYEFCTSHVFYRGLIEETGSTAVFSGHEALDILKSKYPNNEFQNNTWVNYQARLLEWFEAIGLISSDGDTYTINSQKASPITISLKDKKRVSGVFLGQAPPRKVLDLINEIKQGNRTIKNLDLKGYRNAISAISVLGIAEKDNGKLILIEEPDDDVEAWLVNKVEIVDTVKSTVKLISANENISTYEIGNAIQEQYNHKDWSDSSIRRYGSALNVWASWIIRFKTVPLLL